MIWIALQDEREDRKLGILSGGFVDPSRMNLVNSAFANYYQPVRSRPFHQMLQRLRPDLKYNFVDIGAGTGKAMVLAASHGFSQVRGVELVPGLCEQAQQNFQRFSQSYPNVRFDLVCGDALAFAFDPMDSFFFLNDPFSEDVFAPFIERLKLFKQDQAKNRYLWLIYKNNNLRKIPSLEQLKTIVSYEEFDIWGNFFQVYRI